MSMLQCYFLIKLQKCFVDKEPHLTFHHFEKHKIDHNLWSKWLYLPYLTTELIHKSIQIF